MLLGGFRPTGAPCSAQQECTTADVSDQGVAKKNFSQIASVRPARQPASDSVWTIRWLTAVPPKSWHRRLAFAAIIAAGIHGIESEFPLSAALEGNAYESDAERFPSTLREAILALELGTMARGASATRWSTTT